MNTYMKLRIALTIFSSIGFILYIAAFAIPKWSKHATGNEGLWQMCYLNGGVETCSLWTENLKSSAIVTVQILACLGMVFYFLFTITGTLTIFWTKHWKKSRAIKYSTVVFATLAAVFLAASVAIYKTQRASDKYAVTSAWFLTVVATVIAAIAAPCYLVDACRTVAPKKPDKEQFFKNINIPPKPTMANFHNMKPDTIKVGGGGRPPLLSNLRKQKTSFVHPPPKTTNNKLTIQDIEAFPLPPTQTKLNLFDKSEIEDHPAPRDPRVLGIVDTNRDTDSNSTYSSSGASKFSDAGEERNLMKKGFFKHHKTKTIHKDGKTLFKIQNESERLPPVLMEMPGIDNDTDEPVDGPSRMSTSIDLKTQWELEQARRKFAPYFVEAFKKTDAITAENSKEKSNKNIKSTEKRTETKVIKDRVKDVTGIYTNEKNSGETKKTKKGKTKRKNKSRSFSIKSWFSGNSDVETCVNVYDNPPQKQDGLTIHNDVDAVE